MAGVILERLAAIEQGVDSVFKTDLFRHIYAAIEEVIYILCENLFPFSRCQGLCKRYCSVWLMRFISVDI